MRDSTNTTKDESSQEASNTRDMLTRLHEAYLTVALCESWLALDETRREDERAAHRLYATMAQKRQRELSEESDG